MLCKLQRLGATVPEGGGGRGAPPDAGRCQLRKQVLAELRLRGVEERTLWGRKQAGKSDLLPVRSCYLPVTAAGEADLGTIFLKGNYRASLP